MLNWYINPDCSKNIREIFVNIDQVLALQNGELVSNSSISRVIKYSIDNKNFYIKHYFARGKGFRKYFGRSRWQAECENLIFCKKLNIEVPVLVAYGKKTRGFRYKFDGIIITEEVKNATDLKNMAMNFPSIFKQKIWRQQIIKIIAHHVAILHKNNFLHYDLQWRNILVTKTIDAPKVYLFDMPSGRVRKYFFSFAIKRDFYNLYKSAVLFLSRTDQLRFYLLYQSTTYLTDDHKTHIKKLMSYYQHKEYQDFLE